jgi:RNA polymerase sigma factor (sigma-70 family)
MATENIDDKFLSLIQEHRRIIFKICNIYCKNKQDQQDLQQEIIYQLWRSYANYKPAYKFTTWMYRVALNIAISFYRKEKNSNAIIILTDKHEEIEAVHYDDETEKNIRTLYQFIDGLKELDKALMLLYLEEKSYSEIAEILGITETNVATKISRTKEKLKQQSNSFK